MEELPCDPRHVQDLSCGRFRLWQRRMASWSRCTIEDNRGVENALALPRTLCLALCRCSLPEAEAALQLAVTGGLRMKFLS